MKQTLADVTPGGGQKYNYGRGILEAYQKTGALEAEKAAQQVAARQFGAGLGQTAAQLAQATQQTGAGTYGTLGGLATQLQREAAIQQYLQGLLGAPLAAESTYAQPLLNFDWGKYSQIPITETKQSGLSKITGAVGGIGSLLGAAAAPFTGGTSLLGMLGSGAGALGGLFGGGQTSATPYSQLLTSLGSGIKGTTTSSW